MYELSKIQREWKNFINIVKYAEHKKFYICIAVYKLVESNDFNKS